MALPCTLSGMSWGAQHSNEEPGAQCSRRLSSLGMLQTPCGCRARPHQQPRHCSLHLLSGPSFSTDPSDASGGAAEDGSRPASHSGNSSASRFLPVRTSTDHVHRWSPSPSRLAGRERWAEHQAEGEKAAWVGITIFSPVGNNTQTLSFHVFIFWEVYVFEY